MLKIVNDTVKTPVNWRINMSIILHVIVLLVPVAVTLGYPNGTLCYNCRDMAHPRDCFKLTRCGPHELCSVDRFSTDDGIIYYTSGCKPRVFCSGFSGKRDHVIRHTLEVPIMRNSGLHPVCSSCCDTDFCNLNLCDSSVDHTADSLKRCLYCDGVLDPRLCETVSSCSSDEVCFTQKQLNVNGEPRYTLGCRHKQVCAATSTSGSLVGRSIVGNDYCLACCDSVNCNGQICTEDKATTTTEAAVSAPDINNCNENVECAFLVDRFNLCEDSASAREICPVTCGHCSLTTQPSTTVRLCEDRSVCDSLRIHFPETMCSDLKTRTDICPQTCETCEISLVSMTSTTTSTTTTPSSTTTSATTTTPSTTTTSPTTSTTNTEQCKDSPECSHLLSVLDICADAQSARDICPLACNACTSGSTAATFCRDAPICDQLRKTIDVCESDLHSGEPLCPETCGRCHWLPFTQQPNDSTLHNPTRSTISQITKAREDVHTKQLPSTAGVNTQQLPSKHTSCRDEEDRCPDLEAAFHLCADELKIKQFGCYMSCNRCDLSPLKLSQTTPSQTSNSVDSFASVSRHGDMTTMVYQTEDVTLQTTATTGKDVQPGRDYITTTHDHAPFNHGSSAFPTMKHSHVISTTRHQEHPTTAAMVTTMEHQHATPTALHQHGDLKTTKITTENTSPKHNHHICHGSKRKSSKHLHFHEPAQTHEHHDDNCDTDPINIPTIPPLGSVHTCQDDFAGICSTLHLNPGGCFVWHRHCRKTCFACM